MNKTITWIIVAVIIIAGIWWWGSQQPAAPSGETIKIGAILPLTGDLAFLGEEVRKGIDLALSELEEQGIKFQLVYEDDQSLSPTAAVNAAQKLVNIDKVNVGITMLVEESRPIAPIFAENKTPLVVLWDSNQFIKEAGEYIFSNGFSTEKAAEIIADYTYDQLGQRKIAIVSHIDPWAELSTQTFANRFSERGGEIVYREQLIPGTTDYRTTITKVKQVNPDGVYFPLIPMNSIRFLTQAKQLGLSATLLTGDALIQDVITEAAEAAEGV